jgi:hypothetical protein
MEAFDDGMLVARRTVCNEMRSDIIARQQPHTALVAMRLFYIPVSTELFPDRLADRTGAPIILFRNKTA